MNNKSNFRRGSVELLILHLLSQQDYYGYEISTLIREQTDGYLNIPVECLLSSGRQWPHASATTFGGLLRDCQCNPTGIEIYGYTGGRRGRQ